MGGMGTSTSSQDVNQRQNTTQQSQSAPWLPAQPALTGILGQLGANLPQTAMTHPEDMALANMQTNGQNYGGFFAPEISGVAQRLLAGGRADEQAGAVNRNYSNYTDQSGQNYQRYVGQTNPLASNTNYDPYQTPGFADAINTLRGDITNQVNGSFAGAGRDFSGANQMALGRGIAQGIAPSIVSQYQNNVNNQQGAANSLYGAGNTTAGNIYNAGNTNAGLLAGMRQQDLTNRQLGAQTASQALDLQNAGANATLQAEAQRRGIPVQALGLLAQIGIPIAGLGGTSSGSATGTSIGHSEGEKTGSLFDQVGQIGGLLGSGGGISNIFKFISDRRAKQDITQVGTLFDGTPVYRYRYIGQPAFQIGLMAQDIEKVTPEAVGMIGPFKAIDYKLATDKALEAA